jgi:hypothetical protein
MSTYYVSPYGSDSNAGTSASSSGAWLTIAKGLGASGVAVGDTLYICPGTYYEQVTPNKAPASEGERITVIGDVNNVSGFTDGSGNKVPKGDVIWQARSAGKWTDSSSNPAITWTGKSYYTLRGFTIFSYESANAIRIDTSSSNIILEDCFVFARQTCVCATPSVDVVLNVTLRRCSFVSVVGAPVYIEPGSAPSSQLDLNVLMDSCLVLSVNGSYAVRFLPRAGNMAGGITISSCTCVGAACIYLGTNTTLNPTYPVEVKGCLLIGGNAENAQANGQIKEVAANYIVCGSTARINLGAGDIDPNTIVNSTVSAVEYAFKLSLELLANTPQSLWYLGSPESALDLNNRIRPSTGGTLNASTTSGTATSGTASTLTDSGKSWTVNAYTGQIVRITSGTGSGQWRFVASNTSTALTVVPDFATTPDNTSVYAVECAGSTGCVGCSEIHDQDRKEPTTTDSGNGIVINGPGDTEFLIPVDNTSTTISVKARYDSTHAATNKPQAQLVENGEIGFTGETKTMTSAADTWETLTFTAFTPSQKGVVKLRLISRSASGAGKAFFDTISIT